MLTVSDFKPKEGDNAGWARQQIAKITLDFWRDFRQPIGGMLKIEIQELIRANRSKFSSKQREALLVTAENLADPELQVAVESIEKKVTDYKQRKAISVSIDKILNLQERGELTTEMYRQLTREALNVISYQDDISDLATTVNKRIRRREIEKEERFPFLYIYCLDDAIRTFPRGQVGLLLAKYKMGKSTALVHFGQAYALQGFNVMHFTLEDPKSIVEDRYDASLTGIQMADLVKKPNLFKTRFREFWEDMKANIRIVNAVGGGWTIQRMASLVENERSRGFPTDVVIVDYDDKITPSNKYSGDAAKRMSSYDNYTEFTNWMARDQMYGWIAAQAKRGYSDKDGKDKKMIVSGDDAADDISKLRMVGLCLGLGLGPSELLYGADCKYLYVAASKFSMQMIGWPIVGNFSKGVFYDPVRSQEALDRWIEMEKNKVKKKR